MNRVSQRMMALVFIIVFTVGCGTATGSGTDDTAVPTSVAETVQATAVPPTEAPAPTEIPATATSVPATEVPATETAVPATETPMPAAPAVPSVAAGIPIRLVIPSIGVDAAIEQVGDDAQGRMDVPSKVEDVAWYTKRAKPGEPGNAVISGHLDNYKQEPVVFWDLNKLVPGDAVMVTDENGTEWQFEVLSVVVYPDKEVPLDVVFGQAAVPNLNLITCNGVWDANAENYDERLVVYTRLVQ